MPWAGEETLTRLSVSPSASWSLASTEIVTGLSSGVLTASVPGAGASWEQETATVAVPVAVWSAAGLLPSDTT